MNNNEIPNWLTKTENYKPQSDRDGFITKSTESMIKVLSKMKFKEGRPSRFSAGSTFKLFASLVLIVLTASSKNAIFLLVMLALVLLRLCFVDGDILVEILKTTFTAMLISALILIPAAFLGNPKTLTLIVAKVFLTVTIIGIVSGTTPWNCLTHSFKVFHIPDIFIFTFDITLKYIALLGELALSVLTALKLRSVGKNNKKGKSMSGVLGITFIKSREMSEEMYFAMECRGFTGEYAKAHHLYWHKIDWMYFAVLVAVVALFIYLQSLI